ncbi:MAG: LLM class flavin-dependent oxidoreductase [Parvularculaceae bacterium]
MTDFSILDLSPVIQGGDIASSLRHSRDLAQHAEGWGYKRFWMAEHHGIPGVASAATAVCLGFVAEATRTIRVGAGGVMLPNHAPLIIAEQFGTLEALYPGRIDLGLGRAPGGDIATMRALRRARMSDDGEDRFPYDVAELLSYFDGDGQTQVRAIPGDGANVPVWILGSSLYGAQLAAHFGLPYSFASHFAPAQMEDAAKIYRDRFKPSQYLDKPRLMLAANVIAADTDDEAELLATSQKQAFINLRLGKPAELPPPDAGLNARLDDTAKAMLAQVLSCSFIGAPATVEAGLKRFIEKHQPDEMILAGQIYDHAARLKSFEIAAECMKGI